MKNTFKIIILILSVRLHRKFVLTDHWAGCPVDLHPTCHKVHCCVVVLNFFSIVHFMSMCIKTIYTDDLSKFFRILREEFSKVFNTYHFCYCPQSLNILQLNHETWSQSRQERRQGCPYGSSYHILFRTLSLYHGLSTTFAYWSNWPLLGWLPCISLQDFILNPDVFIAIVCSSVWRSKSYSSWQRKHVYFRLLNIEMQHPLACIFGKGLWQLGPPLQISDERLIIDARILLLRSRNTARIRRMETTFVKTAYIAFHQNLPKFLNAGLHDLIHVKFASHFYSMIECVPVNGFHELLEVR